MNIIENQLFYAYVSICPARKIAIVIRWVTQSHSHSETSKALRWGRRSSGPGSICKGSTCSVFFANSKGMMTELIN